LVGERSEPFTESSGKYKSFHIGDRKLLTDGNFRAGLKLKTIK